MNAFPLAAPFLLILAAIVIVLIVLLEVTAFRYAFERMGIHRWTAYAILIASLIGSYVNIPVAVLHGTAAPPPALIYHQGVPWLLPRGTAPPHTILAVNLGGAIIPVLVSGYLLIRRGGYLASAVAFVAVTLVVHGLARPVPGVGIAVPTFVPPLAAAISALALSGSDAPRVAYIAGTLGTLVGADILNIPIIPSLGAPVASIGGAGTFDGVFITGVVAALLAAFVARRPGEQPRRFPWRVPGRGPTPTYP